MKKMTTLFNKIFNMKIKIQKNKKKINKMKIIVILMILLIIVTKKPCLQVKIRTWRLKIINKNKMKKKMKKKKKINLTMNQMISAISVLLNQQVKIPNQKLQIFKKNKINL